MNKKLVSVSAAVFLISFGLIFFELLLTWLFSIVLFAQFTHLALALALLGIGIGAVAQHLWPNLMPEEGLEKRLGWIILVQAVFTVIAVLCALRFPIVTQFETPPETLGERSGISDQLMNSGWFAALLPMLTLPFAAAGLAGVMLSRFWGYSASFTVALLRTPSPQYSPGPCRRYRKKPPDRQLKLSWKRSPTCLTVYC